MRGNVVNVIPISCLEELNSLNIMELNHFSFLYNEPATLARGTRVVINSYLSSGLRPSVRGKITSNNGNLRNLCYTKNICHVILALIT